MTKKLLIILLVVVVAGYATLGFFYWQTRVELLGQIKEVGDLLKQTDALEKQIEELEKQTKEVTIATDKTEYEQEETMKITIKNNTDNEKQAHYPYYTVERFDNENWIEIKKVVCPCEVTCKIAAYFTIQPHSTKEYKWDQMEKWCSDPERISETISKQVPTGKYRVKSVVSDVDKYRSRETIYSNEFIIKEEERKVTITTDKTEYEQREIIEMNLVNPLASPVYYYWNGWPGSSWGSIYRFNEVEDTWDKIETDCTLPPGAIISCDGEQGPFWDPGPEKCLDLTSKIKQINWGQEVCEVKENYCPTGSKVESYSSVVREPAQSGLYKFVATYQQDSACKTEPKILETQFIIK